MGNPETNVYSAAADVETSNASNSQDAIVKPIKGWKGYIWDTWDLPQDQRRLLFKVDAFVLTFASVSVPSQDMHWFLTMSISSDTFSRIWIRPMSTMLFSAAWKRS